MMLGQHPDDLQHIDARNLILSLCDWLVLDVERAMIVSWTRDYRSSATKDTVKFREDSGVQPTGLLQ
jgi:hypothetical protein